MDLDKNPKKQYGNSANRVLALCCIVKQDMRHQQNVNKEKSRFPQALPAPDQDVVVITQDQMDQALDWSRRSPRKRIIQPFHPSNDNTLHRMFNVLQPGTYIRPHRHKQPPKDEALLLLQGKIGVLIFDHKGVVQRTVTLQAGTRDFGIDIKAGVVHTFIVLEKDTVLFEVKTGPYRAQTDKDFASWAPEEGTQEAEVCLQDWRREF